MGVWAYPNDDEKATRLEALMSTPLPKGRLQDLYSLMGDDTLFDTGHSLPEDGDLRHAVAVTLDELFNWSTEARFNVGTVPFERLRALVEPFRDVPVSRISVEPVSDGTPEAAVAAVGAIVVGERFSPTRFEAEAGLGPATHVVRDLETGDVYRFEHVFGVAIQAEPGSYADAVYSQAGSPQP